MILAFRGGFRRPLKSTQFEVFPGVLPPMYSLYHSLLAQHPRQVLPLRCADSTIAQLHRYFEDVVLENNLGALVVESLPPRAQRPARDAARLQELDKTARNLFLWMSPRDSLWSMVLNRGRAKTQSIVFEQTDEGSSSERFVVIADARFSALLASVHDDEDPARRSEERRVGKECTSWCRSRWSPYH